MQFVTLSKKGLLVKFYNCIYYKVSTIQEVSELSSHQIGDFSQGFVDPILFNVFIYCQQSFNNEQRVYLRW